MTRWKKWATAVVLLGTGVARAAAPSLLDDLRQPSAWHASGTDDISTSLQPSPDGKGLCLDFDYHGVSGAATLHRDLPIDFPEHFALSFDVRGTMKPNDLQVKFIDASGDNVWWYRQPAFVPTTRWQRLRTDDRQLTFAWGPTSDRNLRKTAAVEFTVYAGQGGQGQLCIANLRLQPLPPHAAAKPLPPTPNAVFQAAAKQAARGLYPRGFSGEQSYWTLVGVNGGARHSALLSEDGAAEIDKGGWSLEPMVFENGKAIDWASGINTQALQDGYLPIPSVHWQVGSLSMQVTAAASGSPVQSQLLLRYALRNDGEQSRSVTFAVLARPFQVNPPTQFLNTPGGISPIHRFDWNGKALTVNGSQAVLPLQATDAFVASRFADGALPERLRGGERPVVATLDDSSGYAQGALLYHVTLAPHASRQFGVVVPWTGAAPAPGADAMAWLEAQIQGTAAYWREQLNRVSLHLPASEQAIVDTQRSALAQILMSRDGPALQPGTRSYARTWVRDGAMMTEGLIRSGHADVAAQFVQWYAPHQFSNGKVPCCVDARGSDPVPENDSHGELIFAIAELWRYTQDRVMVSSLWPHVEHAVEYMDMLRASQTQQPFRGLMPASISHEGYSAKPMHSYWDDFWALKGYDDAALLAGVLGKHDLATRIGAARDTFRGDLQRSILASTAAHHIDYLPGAAELGDFDATSTTIALSPGDGQTWLPPAMVDRTFQKYWEGFVARRDGSLAWEDYTPYEVRTIASFVRLGWRDRIGQLLAFFFADRRPAAWNQWAEVVGHDARKPRFVGDMPHAWIASDFLRSAFDLFAYERASDHAMVLAAGMQADWLKGGGAGVDRLRTPYGLLTYRLQQQDGALELHIDKRIDIPPGGFVLPWPYAGKAHGDVLVNGKRTVWKNNQVVLRAL
ncbi:discoidin domain-containing protein [Dyella sp.]|uniref:discoidin domain-containing protein n=1 Tax=Dyella sp. TaxID=1869338 RepID=UPI002ED361BA